MTIKEQVLGFLQNHPGMSYTQVGKAFGIGRKTVSAWVNGGVSEARRIWFRAWQKKRIAKAKSILVQFLGGCCYQCGYSGCEDALDFHHKDPSQKEEMVSRLLMGSFDRAVDEARKCILLCCRCHRELHATES